MTTRRKFLRDTAGASAGLVLGFHLTKKNAAAEQVQTAIAPRSMPGSRSRRTTPSRSSRANRNGAGRVDVAAMILAEELDADWAKVRSEHALTDPRYGQQGTGGSSSIRQDYPSLRKVGAAARAMLVQAAALTWNVPAEELKAEKSVVTHGGHRRRPRTARWRRAATLRASLAAQVTRSSQP